MSHVQSFNKYQVLHKRHQIYANREEFSIYKRPVKPMVEDHLRRLERKWYMRSEVDVREGFMAGSGFDQAPFGSLSERSLISSCEYSSFSC
jgi:hypothetical protein